MTPQVIQFNCPTCQAPLTVPIQLAGVSGPCPKCGATITSPAAPQTPPAFPAAAPIPQPSTPPAPHAASPTPTLPPFPQAPSWTQPPPTLEVPPQGSTLPPRRQPGPEMAGSVLPPAPVGQSPAPPQSASLLSPKAPELPTLGGEPSASPASESLLAGFLNPQTPKAPDTVETLESPPTKAQTPTEAPDIPQLGEVDPSAKLAKRSAKPLPKIPGRPGKGSNFFRLGVAALFIVGAVAALIFAFKDPLNDLYLQHLAPLISSPEDTETPPEAPLSGPSIGATVDSPKMEGSQEPAEVVAKPAPTETTSAEQTPKPIEPIATSSPPGPTQPAPLAKADSSPMLPEVVKPAVPAPPGDLHTPPAPKTGLMEVPGTASAEVTINQASSGLGTPTDIPPEAKPAADALMAFLDADNIEGKRKFILGSGDPQVDVHIERYYGQNPPTPTPITSIGFIRHDPNPEVGGGMQTVFMVASPDWKLPIPVMIQETKTGLKLDWIAFVEFKDNWLFKFVQGYHPTPGRFHVSIKRSHYFERDVPDLESKDAFLIQPPQEDFEVAVFVDKKSPLADMLRRELTWSTQYAYVLAEIQWREDGTNQWVELTDVPQLNWYISADSDSDSADKK